MITREQIAEARKLLGWSQKVLAAKTGVSEHWVRGYEQHGLIVPSGGRLAAIVAALEFAGVEFIKGGQSGVRMRANGQ